MHFMTMFVNRASGWDKRHQAHSDRVADKSSPFELHDARQSRLDVVNDFAPNARDDVDVRRHLLL